MELKDFIKNTLIEIATGVKEAQEALQDNSAVINPPVRLERVVGKIGAFESNKQDVKFNVAVTASDETNAGAGIKVASIFNAGGGIKEINTSVSTISFVVPIILPIHKKELITP